MNRPTRPAGRALLVAVLALVLGAHLAGCGSGNAAEPTESADDRTRLGTFLHANSSALVQHWQTWDEVPSHHQHLFARLSNLPVDVDGVQVGLFRISYATTNFPQFSVHLTRAGNSRLLVYNHGHDGLPLDHEGHAIEFLRNALLGGFDLLVTSMPLTGLNAIAADDAPYFIAARGRSQPAQVAVSMLQQPRFQHGLYEVIDDPDHYLHYFIDGAVVPASILAGQSERDSPVRYLAQPGPARPVRYAQISYVGLSGGASVGLTACAAHRFDRCILIAGVMPNYLRVSAETNWGDNEQLTRSFYDRFDVQTLMNLARRTSGRLVLMYNRFDSCCFADPAASAFQQDFADYDIRVSDLNYHGYTASALLALLQ